MDVKNKIRQLIEDQLRSSIENLEATGTTYNNASDLDEDATRSIDDFSQQANDKELEMHVQEQLAVANQRLSWLQTNGNRRQDTLAPGALVETEEQFFFIGIALPTNIEADNKKVTGISEDAPAYAAMEGKKEGDTIEIGGNKHKILHIY